jgi:hypothetical protein
VGLVRNWLFHEQMGPYECGNRNLGLLVCSFHGWRATEFTEGTTSNWYASSSTSVKDHSSKVQTLARFVQSKGVREMIGGNCHLTMAVEKSRKEKRRRVRRKEVSR